MIKKLLSKVSRDVDSLMGSTPKRRSRKKRTPRRTRAKRGRRY